MVHPVTLLALLCMSLPAMADEHGHCTASLDGLRHRAGERAFPLRWEETSMSDGKPLVVSIVEKDGSLFIEFLKTREGLWAEGAAVICGGNAGLEARFSRLRLGPAAPWILRGAFGEGRTFTMSRQGAGPLEIATLGWKGFFLPKRD